MNVLFLCRENVGRSQVAECLFNKLAADKNLPYKATSAGTNASDYEHFGKPLRELVVKTLAENGIDASQNFSKQLNEETAKDADVIVMLAEPELLPDYLKTDPRVQIWQIDDMKNKDLDFHRLTTQKIRDKVTELIEEISIIDVKN